MGNVMEVFRFFSMKKTLSDKFDGFDQVLNRLSKEEAT